MKIQANPADCESVFHAASVLQIIVDGEIGFVERSCCCRGRGWGYGAVSCAVVHSCAAWMALLMISEEGDALFSKSKWFLVITE